MEEKTKEFEKPIEWCGISEFQLYLFHEGTNFKSYHMLGVHLIEREENGERIKGWRFAVWAPHAKCVSLVGDFNDWQHMKRPLEEIGDTGIWYGFYSDLKEGDLYKYAIEANDGKVYYKADPYGVYAQVRPDTASVVHELGTYKWKDSAWMKKREKSAPYDKPMLIYELHAGSWKVKEDGSYYSYEELADELIPYVKDMGYTHIELMPLTEYPYDGSWGYQVTGFFAATSRYGTPEQFMAFIDKFHKNGIGVIMDWVPAHFPKDAHGLYRFDGEPTYEYADSRMGEHKDWGTMVFDYGKSEVVSFLMSSAYFWANEFHVDGLRVDAVSSMLYRDYSRQDGEWTPNKYGGNQNLEAIDFLRSLNKMMFANFPNILMIAEESTAWGMVTGAVDKGGLGFNYKWNMGWMNDTLRYMQMDSYFRKPNHNLLTFLMFYAYSENYILPLSHDEVVHGKGSLANKMFGEYEEKLAQLRLLLGYYLALPGKKMLFMGGELAQFSEWKYDGQLDWQLLDKPEHKKFHQYVQDINHFYLENKAFWQIDTDWDGFSWINDGDAENSVVSFMRKGKAKSEYVVVIGNFTPVKRTRYAIGVPSAGEYEVVLGSDAMRYGGKSRTTKKTYKAVKKDYRDFHYTIHVEVPGFSIIYIKKKKRVKKQEPNALPAEKEKKQTKNSKISKL
jgi:1,4-alpha-glucan branching enzyme